MYFVARVKFREFYGVYGARGVTSSPHAAYRGAAVAVGTRHGKQHQFSPAFGEVLGARLVVPHDLDTDQFGTFSGEVVRRGSALDAARAKARLGMRVAGVGFGLASEASYGPLPGLGWPAHEEVLLFVDDVRGIEVLETNRAAMPFMTSYRVGSVTELPASVTQALPEQALIVRPLTEGDVRDIVKGITDTDVLQSVIAAAASSSTQRLALVEPDLRAHTNPSRQRVLSGLAFRLAHRLATPCPSCGSPGYGRDTVTPGLPCCVCSSPTALTLSEEFACPACPYRTTVTVAQQWADPCHCPSCNP